MTQAQPSMDTNLPSFSIILETENLSTSELEGFYLSLNSLVEQTPSAKDAQEVIIIDSGDTPASVLEALCERDPWIKVHRSRAGISYYEAKMEGAKLATGEVVLLCDSDCIYNSSWLSHILTPFGDSPEIQVVAGETATRTGGAYELAMHFVYLFNGFSGKQQPYPSYTYYCNNIAFRRQLLLMQPIPSELPLYRGNCYIHAVSLTRQGYQIWRQPKAQASHAAPNGWSHFFWRFLLIGRDNVITQRLLKQIKSEGDASTLPKTKFITHIGNLFPILRRVKTVEVRQLIHLPLAIPIALASYLLIFCGRIITYFRPQYLLSTYSAIEGTVYESSLESEEKQLSQGSF